MSGYTAPDMPKIDESKVIGGLEMYYSVSPRSRSTHMRMKAISSYPAAKPLRGLFSLYFKHKAKQGDIIKQSSIEYLNKCYEEMWRTSSWMTGNLRGSIGIIGDVYNDPYHAEIGLDMDEFMKRKKLPSLRDVNVTRNYTTKSGKHVSKTYRYPAGHTMYQRGGYDYSEDQDTTNITANYGVGGPFLHTTWEEIRKKYRKQLKGE